MSAEQGTDLVERSPSLIERWLVRQAKECLATVQYAEDNEGDWAGMLPAADRARLRSDALQFQYAADCIATLVQEITRLRLAAPEWQEEKLWLWKNGDHFWAFRHLYPCRMDGGDPQTLGEPFGWAILKPSAPPNSGPHKAGTHEYVPHRKYPWFCDHCGYPEHERLQHPPTSQAAAVAGEDKG